MKKIFLISLLAVWITSFIYSQETSIYVASWNLENLFDNIDNPDKEDEEFLSDGKKEWTDERIALKMENLSKVIEYMNLNNGPDLLGVIEVENVEILQKLNDNYLNEFNFEITYADAPDMRGIDVGLLYNADKFVLVEKEELFVNLNDRPTRDVLLAKLLFVDDTFYVFINHWPSRSGGQAESEPKRILAASVVKNKVNDILLDNPDAKIIVMGDFNDEPTNISLLDTLQANFYNCEQEISDSTVLFNLSSRLFSDSLGTYMYKQQWNMLDQIIVSKQLLVGEKFQYICDSFEIIKPDFMVTKSGKWEGAPYPSYGSGKFLGGYSDHFPVGIKIMVFQ
ncbi:MAG: hypothetical protein JXA68_02170 [Ignavibacteriales bacterium]|nr:hypothetical protein [Ignavibacteriales bacterium]